MIYVVFSRNSNAFQQDSEMNRMMREIDNDIKVDDEPIVIQVRGRSKSVKAFSIRDELKVILTSQNNFPVIQTARKSFLSSISPDT